jgi:hypothetical protein
MRRPVDPELCSVASVVVRARRAATSTMPRAATRHGTSPFPCVSLFFHASTHTKTCRNGFSTALVRVDFFSPLLGKMQCCRINNK